MTQRQKNLRGTRRSEAIKSSDAASVELKAELAALRREHVQLRRKWAN